MDVVDQQLSPSAFIFVLPMLVEAYSSGLVREES